MKIARHSVRLPLLLAALVSAMTFVSNGPATAQGSGDLAIAPTRIVLEGRERAAALNLTNRGTRSTTFRISVVNMKMLETGILVEITKPEPGAPFAEDLIRFAPRSITLEPGASQVIRIALRKPPELPEGEYRSHLFVRGDPPRGSGRSVERDPEDEDLQIQLTPIYGITVPVIVRHGNLKVDAGLSDLALLPADRNNPTPRLRFVMDRSGTASLYGDIRISFVPQGKKDEIVIGEINGIAVYTTTPRRIVEARLSIPDGLALRNGTIKISYTRVTDDGARPLANAELPVN